MAVQGNKKEKWIWEWERRAHPVIVFQLAKVYSQDKAWPQLRLPVLFVSKEQEVHLYYSHALFGKSGWLAKVIQKDSTFLADYQKKMRQEKEVLAKYCRELACAPMRKLAVDQIVILLRKYHKLYRQHGVVAIRTFNRVGPTIVEEFLKQKYGRTETIQWLPILFAATKESMEKAGEKELLQLAQKIKLISDKNKVNLFIKRYHEKYQWLPCGYADEKPLSEQDIWQKVKIVLKNKMSPDKQLEKMESLQRSLRMQRTSLLKKLRLPKFIFNLVEAVSEFTFYKDYIRMNYNQLHFYSQLLFKEVARRLKLSLKEVHYLSIPEMIVSLRRGSVNRKLIANRLKYYVCYTAGKNIYIFTGQKARVKEREIVQIVHSTAQIIKGISASLGLARGMVRVVKHIAQARTFPKGAVLVTPMTTPELVSVAKKAAAIVTDEGGLTCHAAIVSRELGIPCVIGTRVATKVLKDGDRVEVDANRGLVRKL
jgi:phosphohistidine swiveling domain-containing protein